MPEWVGNPAFWITAAIVVAGTLLAIGKWVGSVNSDRKSFDTFMREVREKLDKIMERLPRPTSSAHSPVQLTDFGKLIRDNHGVAEWASKEALSLVDASKGKEEFEIYEACIDHVSAEFAKDAEFTRTVKSVAYKVGTPSSNVLPVYQIELRDQILKLLSA